MSSFCYGYGSEGHKLVALIADKHITSQTRAAVAELLGEQSMADVSSWADQYRASHRNTSGWHYVDYEISDGKLLEGSAKGGTVIDVITSQSAILANPDATPADRKQALMFIIHFVGDMHQPLHCADNFDKGGNNVKVVFLGRANNLHRVWDSAIIQQIMIESGTSTTVESLANSIDQEFASQQPTAGNGTISDWANQSHQMAKKYAYSYLKGDTLSSITVTLGRDYYDLCMPALRQEVALGGYRLAHVLNTILGVAPRKPTAPPQETTKPY